MFVPNVMPLIVRVNDLIFISRFKTFSFFLLCITSYDYLSARVYIFAGDLGDAEVARALIEFSVDQMVSCKLPITDFCLLFLKNGCLGRVALTF
jgi:hypothetical protein